MSICDNSNIFEIFSKNKINVFLIINELLAKNTN
jgi:hypothetical protein